MYLEQIKLRLRIVETKKRIMKNLRKHYVVNFFLCILLSLLITGCYEFLTSNNLKKGLSTFFYLLIFGIPLITIYSALIYFPYFFSFKFFVKKTTAPRNLFLPILFGLIYFSCIVLINWINSQDRFYSFYDFIKSTNYYLIFSLVCVFQIGVFTYKNSLNS